MEHEDFNIYFSIMGRGKNFTGVLHVQEKEVNGESSLLRTGIRYYTAHLYLDLEYMRPF